MDAWLIFFVLLIVLTLAFYVYVSAPITDVYATNKGQIETLLDSSGTNEQSKLLARALPNGRLISALGIKSTFVSDNVDLHHIFVKDTKELVQRWSNDWVRFAETATFIIDMYFNLFRKDPEEFSIVPFDNFVQAVTLAVVLVSFFETDVNLLNFHDVVFVARGINQRWRDSKLMKLSRDGLDEINVHLRKWVPESYLNPLDYIIPSYETMWRVIAVTVAEEYRNAHAHTACNKFLQNPDFDHFNREHGHSYSVHAMIRESLRLHPPTRHISRAIGIQPKILRSVLGIFGIRYKSRAVADVERFQRSPAWGPHPDVFDPSRHTRKEVETNPDAILFAFGHGSMQCVARRWAPHAAGIIFAAIMDGIYSGSCVIENDGGSIGTRDGWEKWRMRMSAVW